MNRATAKNDMVLEGFQGWHFGREIQKLILLEVSCVQESLVKDGEAWNVVELEARIEMSM